MNREENRQSPPWLPDQGDGTFRNPILHADYSDPDVIRVGEDFYMTASSFGHVPGLPILHSKDLINWSLIHHAIPAMPLAGYEVPMHGNGVWAPSLRYHDGRYWIFYGDPDVGILMTSASDPRGPWTSLRLVKRGRGLIDPCPFWDDDGQAYLVHAYAQSRSGIKHRLDVHRMAPDGTRLLDDSRIIVDDPVNHPTIEGPKMYKRNGYYYIFAPAGGVEEGWQTVLRSRQPFGPYESRIVLHQGETDINGPHQGGWVELESGESWFMHFQHKEAYGRIVHLQPLVWRDDWPVIGDDANGDGTGEPVAHSRKPDVGSSYPAAAPACSDEFGSADLSLQWQWQANPSVAWYSLTERVDHLRLYSVPSKRDEATLFRKPNLLLQKFPALSFEASASLDATGLKTGERAGLIVFGYRYACLTVRKEGDRAFASLSEGNAEEEAVRWEIELEAGTVEFKAVVRPGAICTFQYRQGSGSWQQVESPEFPAEVSKWVGAKVGLFAQGLPAESGSNGVEPGYADFDWFRVSPVHG